MTTNEAIMREITRQAAVRASVKNFKISKGGFVVPTVPFINPFNIIDAINVQFKKKTRKLNK